MGIARAILVLTLLTALGGCYSVRHRNDPDVLAATGQPPAETKVKPAKEGREAKQNLPTGLAGDREHHAYTEAPQ